MGYIKVLGYILLPAYIYKYFLPANIFKHENSYFIKLCFFNRHQQVWLHLQQQSELSEVTTKFPSFMMNKLLYTLKRLLFHSLQ